MIQIETLSPDTLKITPPTKLKADDFVAIAPQIEAYAAVLRNLHSSAQIRVGLYYPRMSILDWWEL